MKKILLLASLPIIIFAKTITFQEALTLTLKNNKELKAKKLSIEKAKEDLKEAKGYLKGNMEFAENISRTNHAGYVFGMKLASREADFAAFGFKDFLNHKPSPMDPSVLTVQPDDLNNPDPRNNFETKVTYKIPLFTGYKLESAQAMARLQILANKAKYLHDEKQIGLEVLKAYNGAVAAKKFINMTQKAKYIAARFVKTSQDLFNNKLTRIIDVKQAKMAQFSINTKIKEAKTKFKLAIAYLQFLTFDKTISDVGDFAKTKINLNHLEILQKDAIDQRDDYAWMKHNTATMKKKIKFDSANEHPTIGAQLEYGSNDDFINMSLAKDYYLGAIGLTYTLFDGDITSIKKQKAKIDYAKTKHYFEYMKDGIKLEVKKNYLELLTKTKTLKEKIKLSQMAKDILKETEDIYKNNLRFRTNMMYLLMSLEKMLIAQADVISSSYEKTIVQAQLKLSIGNSLQIKGEQ